MKENRIEIQKKPVVLEIVSVFEKKKIYFLFKLTISFVLQEKKSNLIENARRNEMCAQSTHCTVHIVIGVMCFVNEIDPH